MQSNTLIKRSNSVSKENTMNVSLREKLFLQYQEESDKKMKMNESILKEAGKAIKLEDRAILEWQNLSYFVPIAKPTFLSRVLYSGNAVQHDSSYDVSVRGMPAETIINEKNSTKKFK